MYYKPLRVLRALRGERETQISHQLNDAVDESRIMPFEWEHQVIRGETFLAGL